MYHKTENEAIAAAKEAAGGLTDFYGQNCDDCHGWDGESRRCECGNRRVYWETNEVAEGFYAYAQAY